MAERNRITEALARHAERIDAMKEEAAKSTAPDIGEERVSSSVLARKFRSGSPAFRRRQVERLRKERGDDGGHQAMMRLLGKSDA